MASAKDEGMWGILVAAFIVLDSFKIYLSLRNIVAVGEMRSPPLEMQGIMNEEAYQSVRNRTIDETLTVMIDVLIELGFRIAKAITPYYPWIWWKTADYSLILSTRAVWFSALDACLSRCVFMPFVFLSAIATTQSDPFLIVIKMVLNIVVHTFAAAVGTFTLVLCTDRFGVEGLAQILVIMNYVGVAVVALYIHFYIPYVFKPLPQDGTGMRIRDLADLVGYPQNRIFVDGDIDALPNAYYSSALGAKMIVISETLINDLSPDLLISVLAHELGHWNSNHAVYQYLFSSCELSARVFLWLQAYGSTTINGIFYLPNKTHPVVPVYLAVSFIWPLFEDIFSGVTSLFGTYCEYEADDYCSQLGQERSLRQALLTMTAKPRICRLFDNWFSAWFLGHPTILSRIRRIDRRQQRNN